MESLVAHDIDVFSGRELTSSVYFEDESGEGKRFDTPVFKLGSLDVGDRVKGPAVITDETLTIVLGPRSEAVVTTQHLLVLHHARVKVAMMDCLLQS
jgi:5-oxoprolinase (ATP-hydrolysing)